MYTTLFLLLLGQYCCSHRTGEGVPQGLHFLSVTLNHVSSNLVKAFGCSSKDCWSSSISDLLMARGCPAAELSVPQIVICLSLAFDHRAFSKMPIA
jgi:hypothetical protein